MSDFAYRSLIPQEREIRLIYILPMENQDSASYLPVSCALSHISLDHPPAYTALSYNWGDTSHPSVILLNGYEFTVTKNLEAALRHLRLEDKPLTLWIDALCINQRDDEEKSHQLEQMREIYSRAHSVVAWLGPAADNSDIAMQWIQQYGKRSFELGIGGRPEMQLRHLLESLEAHEKGLADKNLERFINDLKTELSPTNPEYPSLIGALMELFKRPYWSRIWVVQELRSASNPLFACGEMTATEEALHHALRLLRNFRQYQLLKSRRDTPVMPFEKASIISIDPSDPILQLKIRRAGEPSPLIYLMRSLRRFQATDPRDKVFALLGIAGDTEALGLHPNYHKSCAEVYTELAQVLIRNGYVDLLSFCEFPKQIAGLPSWVPDWSCQSDRSPLQQRSLDRSTQPLKTFLEPRFSASGVNYIADMECGEVISHGTTLLLHATFLGEVQQVGISWERKAIGRWLHDLYSLACLMPDTSKLSSGWAQAVWCTAVAGQEVRRRIKKPRLTEEVIRTVDLALKDKDLSLVDAQILTEVGLSDYCQQLQAIAQGRRPLLASEGHIGIGPRETEPGDLIFILLGADVPYILRRYNQDGKLQLIGEAYVHGFMDGEAMSGTPVIETISLL